MTASAGAWAAMAESIHRAERLRSAVRGIEVFSLSSNRWFPRHAHDQFGLGVIHAGAHRSWSGAGSVEAVAGDVITVNPGEMHDGGPLQGQARSWRMLYFDPVLVDEALRDEMRGSVEFIRPVLRDAPLALRFARLFARLTVPQTDRMAVDEKVLLTLAHLVARLGSRPLATGGHPPPVALALRRIDEAPERPVTLAQLAGLAGVSRFQLLRGFARTVGTTPHAYLLQQRVRLARRLLAAGRRPAEAAVEAGFADQSHLTRAFGRQFGLTPARYRAASA